MTQILTDAIENCERRIEIAMLVGATGDIPVRQDDLRELLVAAKSRHSALSPPSGDHPLRGELWPPILEPHFVGFTFSHREIVDWFVNPQGKKTSARATIRAKAAAQ